MALKLDVGNGEQLGVSLVTYRLFLKLLLSVSYSI